LPGTRAERTGDERFEPFFQQYSREIFGYSWRLTGEEQAANDLCQETFIRAWQNFARVSAYEQPRSWLFRVATNLAINHQRHRGHLSDIEQRLRVPGAGAGDDPAAGLAERDAVRDALLHLPIRQRTALVLRAVYSLPFDEIAGILGVSVAAAKMTLSRGRTQFRTYYLREDSRP
ncbi:MAG: RNA polymerase sigma factor, partial [Ktedonobacterales bacterium]